MTKEEIIIELFKKAKNLTPKEKTFVGIDIDLSDENDYYIEIINKSKLDDENIFFSTFIELKSLIN